METIRKFMDANSHEIGIHITSLALTGCIVGFCMVIAWAYETAFKKGYNEGLDDSKTGEIQNRWIIKEKD